MHTSFSLVTFVSSRFMRPQCARVSQKAAKSATSLHAGSSACGSVGGQAGKQLPTRRSDFRRRTAASRPANSSPARETADLAASARQSPHRALLWQRAVGMTLTRPDEAQQRRAAARWPKGQRSRRACRPAAQAQRHAPGPRCEARQAQQEGRQGPQQA